MRDLPSSGPKPSWELPIPSGGGLPTIAQAMQVAPMAGAVGALVALAAARILNP